MKNCAVCGIELTEDKMSNESMALSPVSPLRVCAGCHEAADAVSQPDLPEPCRRGALVVLEDRVRMGALRDIRYIIGGMQ